MTKETFVKNYLPIIEAAVAAKVLPTGDKPLAEWRSLWSAELQKPIND